MHDALQPRPSPSRTTPRLLVFPHGPLRQIQIEVVEDPDSSRPVIRPVAVQPAPKSRNECPFARASRDVSLRWWSCQPRIVCRTVAAALRPPRDIFRRSGKLLNTLLFPGAQAAASPALPHWNVRPVHPHAVQAQRRLEQQRAHHGVAALADPPRARNLAGLVQPWHQAEVSSNETSNPAKYFMATPPSCFWWLDHPDPVFKARTVATFQTDYPISLDHDAIDSHRHFYGTVAHEYL